MSKKIFCCKIAFSANTVSRIIQTNLTILPFVSKVNFRVSLVRSAFEPETSAILSTNQTRMTNRDESSASSRAFCSFLVLLRILISIIINDNVNQPFDWPFWLLWFCFLALNWKLRHGEQTTRGNNYLRTIRFTNKRKQKWQRI